MISTVSFNWFHQSGAIRRSDKRHSWLFFFYAELERAPAGERRHHQHVSGRLPTLPGNHRPSARPRPTGKGGTQIKIALNTALSNVTEFYLCRVFLIYLKKNPLLVLILPEKRKLPIH